MIRHLLRHLRHNLVAYLALFLALTSTGYAASARLLPKNSVGSAQVINGSLRTADLSTKARTALKGNRGLQGLTGAKGDTGGRGATGPAGPANAYFADVSTTGAVVDSSPGVTATLNSTGEFVVTFPRSVVDCGAAASIGFNKNGGGDSDTNSTEVHMGLNGDNTVHVTTLGSGVRDSFSFHLIVVC